MQVRWFAASVPTAESHIAVLVFSTTPTEAIGVLPLFVTVITRFPRLLLPSTAVPEGIDKVPDSTIRPDPPLVTPPIRPETKPKARIAEATAIAISRSVAMTGETAFSSPSL